MSKHYIEVVMSKKKPMLSELELIIVDLHEEAINNSDGCTRATANSLLNHYLRYKSLTAKQLHLAKSII